MVRQESALQMVWYVVSLVTTRSMLHQRATELCRLHTDDDAILALQGDKGWSPSWGGLGEVLTTPPCENPC